MSTTRESGYLLLVDDNEANLDMLGRRLQRAGYTVTTALDGPRALETLEHGAIEVVLLDIQMPGMSGLEVLARIRRTRTPAELPVIMVTALDESEDIVRALDGGASDYITKPVDVAVCTARVRTQLALRRATAQLREATDELSRRNARLEELDKEKNHFIGMAAHDLRNPLSVVQFYAEFLQRAGATLAPEQVTTFLAQIHSSSEFMLKLVNDLLSVAKIESGHLQLERTTTDLRGLVRRSVTLNATVATRKQIHIVLHEDDAVPALSLDAVKIEQVLNNLLTNAIKFSHPGTVVDVWLRLTGNTVQVAVEDHGQGIPAAEIANLFKAFQRTSVQATAGEKSTGLGLVIVRRIVEGHGGTIEVESEVGRGTTFRVTLPIASGG